MPIETSVSPLSSMSSSSADDEQEEAAETLKQRSIEHKPKLGSLHDELINQINDINLARYIEDNELDRIGMLVAEEYRIDEQSRDDWMNKAVKAMNFATQQTEAKSFPWPGASNFIYPLITQAAIEFAARTYPAIVQGRNVVKGIVWGDDKGTPVSQESTKDHQPVMQSGGDGQQQTVWLIAPGAKRERADRIAEHMSWQLLEDMPEWEPQTDQMLHQLPVIGGAARKTFRDPVEGKNKSLFVSLFNLTWNYNAPSFEAAPRHTEKVLLYPNQIADLERTFDDDEDDGGMFLPLNYGVGGSSSGETFNGQPIDANEGADADAPHVFIEQHRRLDLDGDGYAEPYIVTVHLRSCKVVRIVARYDEDGIKASKKGDMIYSIAAEDQYTLYPFLPNIDGGSYPMGFGQLLRPLNEGINSTLNQLFDAGTLANTGGGFISDQIGLPSGQTLFGTGKYHRVTTKGGAIRDAVLPLPFPGPNQVLFSMLGALISASKEIAGIGNILAGDASIANAPPTTVLALIEQGMKFYTAIAKRVFRAEKAELQKLFLLNKKYITTDEEYRVGDECRIIYPNDYSQGGGVEPIADPTMTTDMQKLGRAQIILSTTSDPMIDKKEAYTRLFDAANIDRAAELFAQPDPAAAQQAQIAQQFMMAKAQAELGAERAKELKDQSQAFLNMSLARKNASAGEEAFIEAQLNYLRLHIEALNTQVKAAAVDHKFHDTGMKNAQGNAERLANQATQSAAQPTPAPMESFPVPPSPASPNPAPPPVTMQPDVLDAGPSGPPSQSIPQDTLDNE